MSKYEHKADLEQIFYVDKLIEFMTAIQKSVAHDYIYYFENSFPVAKLNSVLDRLDSEYNIAENRRDRHRRNKTYNQAVTLGHFFYPGGDTVYFILMSKLGEDGNRRNNFFEKLKYKDATNKDERFVINHYELVRHNREKINITDGNIEIKNQNEVWSFGFSEQYKDKIMSDLNNALRAGNWSKIGYLFKEIESALPFGKVRIDYKYLKAKMYKIIHRYIKSSGIPPNEIWDGIGYNPTKNLAYLRGTRVNRFTMKSILNPSILKRIVKET